MLPSMKRDEGSVSLYIKKDPPAAEYKSNATFCGGNDV
jgi:hypothetical protein